MNLKYVVGTLVPIFSCPSIILCSAKTNEYNDEKHSGALLLDWRFSYKQPTFKDQYLEFTLDVNNVLNKRISVSSTSRTKTYKMGRNFWFGVSYNW